MTLWPCLADAIITQAQKEGQPVGVGLGAEMGAIVLRAMFLEKKALMGWEMEKAHAYETLWKEYGGGGA